MDEKKSWKTIWLKFTWIGVLMANFSVWGCFTNFFPDWVCLQTIFQGVLFLHVPNMQVAIGSGDFMHGWYVASAGGTCQPRWRFQPTWSGKCQYCWRHSGSASTVDDFSLGQTAFQQLGQLFSICRWGSATPFGDLGEVRKRHSLWRFRLFKTPLPLVF